MTSAQLELDELHEAVAEHASPLPADSLALGMAFLLSLTVVQRFVGLARNLLFCRFLDEEQLGLWSLGLSFLMLAAPVAVLGLPGSFGRYLEYYRQRGQLRDFLRYTTVASALLAIAAATMVCLARDWFAWFIYTESSLGPLVLCLAGALVAAIGFNFLIELLTALRQVRVVSLMQFASSLLFTIVGLGLLCGTQLGAKGVVAAYAVSCLVPCLAVLPLVARVKLGERGSHLPLAGRDVWRKLLTFAASIWMINVLTNLCDSADRYLVLHWSGLDAHTALGLVGQLHASRVVPAIMIGMAALVGGAILPYLSHDWEAGRRHAVSVRLNLTLKLVGLAFTAGAALVLVVAPVLFGWVLQGRYDGGLSVLPLSLMYCVWFSLALLAQNYLLCAEQTKLGGLAFVAALGCNIVLNLLLLPLFGLHGAAFATATANAVLLASMLGLSRRLGMTVDPGTWLVCLAPLLLLLGPWPAAATVLLLVWLAMWGQWLFGEEEKQQLLDLVLRLIRKEKQELANSGETASE